MKNLLNYQSSEYDCGPVSLTNAIRYLFDREVIYPDENGGETMKKIKGRLLSLFLILVMAVSVVACGGAGRDGNGADGSLSSSIRGRNIRSVAYLLSSVWSLAKGFTPPRLSVTPILIIFSPSAATAGPAPVPSPSVIKQIFHHDFLM